MPLSGHTREFSLPDLLQVQSLARADCTVDVQGPHGRGRLVVSRGTVIDASYGTLRGADAAFALVVEDDLHYSVSREVAATEATLALSAQELVMEAMRRKDEGLLPVLEPPRPRAVPPPAATPPAPPESVARPETAAARPRWRQPVVLALALLALVGVFLIPSLVVDSAPPAPPEAEAISVAGATAAGAGQPGRTPRDPVDGATLTGPRDGVPEALFAQAVPSPDPAAPIQPTVVLRLLVDADGRVADASVYRPRLQFEAFEAAALEAVRAWRFDPGRREGVAVPVLINWPVRFEEVAR